VATVVAAGLWVVYAVNPASEAAAMVRGLAHWFPSLLENGEVLQGVDRLSVQSGEQHYDLSITGGLWAVVFMALIVGLNLLPPRRLIRLNLFITMVRC
jgi:amino acid transporter